MSNLDKLISFLEARSDIKEEDMKRIVRLREIDENYDSDSLEIIEMANAITALMESDSFNFIYFNELLFKLLESLEAYFLRNEVNNNVKNVADEVEVEEVELDQENAAFNVEISSVSELKDFLFSNIENIGLEVSDLKKFWMLVQQEDNIDLFLEEFESLSSWSDLKDLVIKSLTNLSHWEEVDDLVVKYLASLSSREKAFEFEFEDFDGLKENLYELTSDSTKKIEVLDSIFKSIQECEDQDRDRFRNKMMSYFKNKVLKTQKEDMDAIFDWLIEFKNDVENFNKEKEETKKQEFLLNMPRPKLDGVVAYSKFVKRVSRVWHPDLFPGKVCPQSLTSLGELNTTVSSTYGFSGSDHKTFELETNNNLKSFLDDLQNDVIQLFDKESVSDAEICKLFESYVSRVYGVWSIDVGDSENVHYENSNASSEYEYENYEEQSSSDADEYKISFVWGYGTQEVERVSDKELLLDTPAGTFLAEKIQKSNVVIERSINFNVAEFDFVNVFLKADEGYMHLEKASSVRNTSIIDQGSDMVCRVSSNFVESVDFTGSYLELHVSNYMFNSSVRVGKNFTGDISQMKKVKIEFDGDSFENFELKSNEVDDLQIICSNDLNLEKKTGDSEKYHVEIDFLNNSRLRLFNGARVKIGTIDDNSYIALDNPGKLYVDYGNETYIVERKSKSDYDVFSIPTMSRLKTSRKGFFWYDFWK